MLSGDWSSAVSCPARQSRVYTIRVLLENERSMRRDSQGRNGRKSRNRELDDTRCGGVNAKGDTTPYICAFASCHRELESP